MPEHKATAEGVMVHGTRIQDRNHPMAARPKGHRHGATSRSCKAGAAPSLVQVSAPADADSPPAAVPAAIATCEAEGDAWTSTAGLREHLQVGESQPKSPQSATAATQLWHIA